MSLEFELFLAALALAAGGVLKGAIGAGAPVLAIPVLALIFDVRYAVAVLVVPNLITNLWQWWQYRQSSLPFAFTALFAGFGALGALVGSFMLAFIPPDVLLTIVGLSVVLYIVFRVVRADWVLPYARALPLAGPAGFLGGMLQGAVGLSAPVSISFMSAMKLDRPTFIATISVFFMVISILQGPALAGLGILSWEILLQGVVALALLLGFMPVGAWLARHVSRETFDRLILVLLAIIAAKILLEPFF